MSPHKSRATSNFFSLHSTRGGGGVPFGGYERSRQKDNSCNSQQGGERE